MKIMMDAQDRRTTVKRYNAGIHRARGLLELAAGLYDSSLSSESRKAAEGVLQTDSPLGNALKLSLTPKPNDRKGIALSFTTGGFGAIRAVAEGKVSLAWVNPSVQLTMAYRGKGPFPKRLPLRTIAVFPSYDVMGFAVRESTGITSISQIKKDRFPLKVSIRRMDKAARKDDSTMFTVAEILRAAGFTLEDIRRWGGRNSFGKQAQRSGAAGRHRKRRDRRGFRRGNQELGANRPGKWVLFPARGRIDPEAHGGARVPGGPHDEGRNSRDTRGSSDHRF